MAVRIVNCLNTGQQQLLVTFLVGSFSIVALQWLQFGVIYPMVFNYALKNQVDRETCTCDCWDTWFKGYYENWPGRYHSVYFNVTLETGLIWMVTVFYVLALYEAVRHIVLSFWAGNYRVAYLLLFLSGLHSHQYTWWSYVGYFNDHYYDQLIHQTLFSVTEVYAAWIVLVLATTRRPSSQPSSGDSSGDWEKELSRLSMLAAISLAHLALGSLDQFVDQNVFGRGHLSQKSRNVGFIVSDALGLLLSAKDILFSSSPPANFQLQSLKHFSSFREIASKVIRSPHFRRSLLTFVFVFACGTFL